MFVEVCQRKVFHSRSQISEGKSCIMECYSQRVTFIFENLKEKMNSLQLFISRMFATVR